jgi:hypothetical protein
VTSTCFAARLPDFRRIPAWLLACATLLAVFALPRSAVCGQLDSVAFIAGHWERQGKDGRVDEIWLPSAGGFLLGMSREVREGKKTLFEYLRIEERPDGVFYVASPQGGPPTDFRLVKSEGSHAVFENPTHDFPQRIEYWMDGQGLAAKISSLDEKSATEWRYQRASETTPVATK